MAFLEAEEGEGPSAREELEGLQVQEDSKVAW